MDQVGSGLAVSGGSGWVGVSCVGFRVCRDSECDKFVGTRLPMETGTGHAVITFGMSVSTCDDNKYGSRYLLIKMSSQDARNNDQVNPRRLTWVPC